MQSLSALGFNSFFEQQLLPEADPSGIPARVIAEHRGTWEVASASGEGRAQLSGRVRIEQEGVAIPAVGDWVVLDAAPGRDSTSTIRRVLTRRTVFTRGAAGKESRPQVIAANVDIVFVVCGLDADFNIRRIERYQARIFASGAMPAVLLNKVDLCPDAAARLLEVSRCSPGVPVHLISARDHVGLDDVRKSIREGVTAALVGSSGVGKSTLVNAILGEDRMPTGEVRARDNRGRHVTTRRQLIRIDGGGLLLDTPGMRELQLLDDDGIDTVFDDIAALADHCHFRDCTHDAEPGCAVKAALAAGELDAGRFDSYRRLQREARSNEIRHDVHRRKEAARMWGQLHREVDQLRKWKGGKP